MIDLHTHVLPGIDDGPVSLEDSIELARMAAAAGTTELVATPHVTWDLPTTAAAVADGVRALQSAFEDRDVPIRLRTGGELAISRAVELGDEELSALHLGGGEWLLAECPLSPAGTGFDALLHHLQARGHRILLAHPERSPVLQRAPHLVRTFVDAGMLTSITAGALVGRFGRTVQSFAYDLVEEGLVHSVASDAHDLHRRPPGMREALLAADADLPGLADRIDWLCTEVPRAILDGGPLPPAPGPDPRRRRRRRLLRRVARSR